MLRSNVVLSPMEILKSWLSFIPLLLMYLLKKLIFPAVLVMGSRYVRIGTNSGLSYIRLNQADGTAHYV